MLAPCCVCPSCVDRSERDQLKFAGSTASLFPAAASRPRSPVRPWLRAAEDPLIYRKRCVRLPGAPSAYRAVFRSGPVRV